jgi:hypothetical protein
MRKTGVILAVALSAGLAPTISTAQEAPQITARDIVQKCDARYPGEDQQTRLKITLRDRDANDKVNIYRRYWKDFKGRDGITEKMVLFTEYPPDAQGSAFMRWAYTGKNAEQWIYLPALKKTRRVSVRDPGDSFLGSDLTYADISPRGLDEDDHTVLGAEEHDGQKIINIKSVPRPGTLQLYSHVVSQYVMTNNWDDCHKQQIDYYDPKGELLKQQSIKWQRIDDAWLWSEVNVHNVQTNHRSIFEVSEAKVNIGLSDDVFSERNLTRGGR